MTDLKIVSGAKGDNPGPSPRWLRPGKLEGSVNEVAMCTRLENPKIRGFERHFLADHSRAEVHWSF